ncbi:hypothetical protein AB1Y20_003488 [Prymnesium parvum]|uniref:Uncharacterized protein n=1 Tax=Prymnesium parvum TaxID=97485 RepID=A0AB34JBZ0_PRYPA
MRVSCSERFVPGSNSLPGKPHYKKSPSDLELRQIALQGKEQDQYFHGDRNARSCTAGIEKKNSALRQHSKSQRNTAGEC